MSRSKKNYEVVDNMDDFDEPVGRSKSKNQQEDLGSDPDFDELPNGIKFETEDTEEGYRSDDDSDDEDDIDDEDLDREPAKEPEDDEPEDEDDIENIKDKSQFTRRLMRERRLREEAENDAETMRNNFNAVNKRVVEIESTLKARTSSEETARKENELNSKLIDLRAQKRNAIENGETDKQILLDEQIADVVSDIKIGRMQQSTADEAAKKIAEGRSEVVEPVNRHVTRWMRQHGELYRKDSIFRGAAMAADREIAGEGYDKNSPEYFDELSKRLSKRFPEEFKRSGKKGDGAPPRSKHPLSGADAERSVTKRKAAGNLDIQVRGNKAALNKQHFRIMRSFGMDPESPDDVNTFVRENLPKQRRR